MWLLPTRNRPKACEAMIACMKETGQVPDTVVMVDGPMYNIEWPSHWKIHESYGHMEMQRALNALYRLYPNEKTYGVLTDQSRPATPLWATKMEEAADDGFIGMSNPVKQRVNPRSGRRRITTTCLGGELVRAVGWVWLDTLVHLYGDDAWEDIGYALNVIRYLPDTVIVGLLKKDGEVPIDANHKRIWQGQRYMAPDAEAYAAWKKNDFLPLIQKLEKFRCYP